jgi:hypothetical protein
MSAAVTQYYETWGGFWVLQLINSILVILSNPGSGEDSVTLVCVTWFYLPPPVTHRVITWCLQQSRDHTKPGLDWIGFYGSSTISWLFWAGLRSGEDKCHTCSVIANARTGHQFNLSSQELPSYTLKLSIHWSVTCYLLMQYYKTWTACLLGRVYLLSHSHRNSGIAGH